MQAYKNFQVCVVTYVLHCVLSRVDTSTKGLLEHLSRAHAIAAIGDQGYLVGKPSLRTRRADGTVIAQFASWKKAPRNTNATVTCWLHE